MFIKFFIFALAASGQGISGGDRIFIELVRRWSRLYPVELFVWEEGAQMCSRMNLVSSGNLNINIVKLGVFQRLGPIFCYLARVVASLILAVRFQPKKGANNIIYSASEFWMDSLPVFLIKLKNNKFFWIAAWYQTAPNPLKGYAEGYREKSYKIKALIYWLIQLPIKPIIRNFADLILVNNENEKKAFKDENKQGKVAVILGAVNLEDINKYRQKYRFKKIYDGVFQGRFHPQKGVVELIDIWREVVNIRKSAKLVMIGDGPLMPDVKKRIRELKLEDNIILEGYVFDGSKKYQIFSQSKVVMHPSFYDSGGMAAAEAMAFELPAVAFNLKSYDSYYPQGVLKVPIGDKKKFARAILQLLEDQQTYDKLKKQALNMIKNSWSWDSRAEQILAKLSDGSNP